LLHVFPYGRPGFKAKNPGLGIAQKNTDPSPVEVPTKGGAVKQVKQRVHKPDKFVEEKWAYSLKEAFLRFFGDLKLFDQQPRLFVLPHLVSTLPFGGTLLYDPRSYRIKGRDMRQAMANLQPGDILVRGFDNYVDGKFIPGFFSHAGLYLGRVGMKQPYVRIGVLYSPAVRRAPSITPNWTRCWAKRQEVSKWSFMP
jgi:hypothetical protein